MHQNVAVLQQNQFYSIGPSKLLLKILQPLKARRKFSWKQYDHIVQFIGIWATFQSLCQQLAHFLSQFL